MNGGAYPPTDIVAPDSDFQVLCAGCTRLGVQIVNQPVYITFGLGLAAPVYGVAERYLPLLGDLTRRFDAFKVRAAIPAALLPAGQSQAHVILIPRR